MNKKLIAAAITTALAPPIASAQDMEVTLYGRINNALDYFDTSGEDDVWGLRNVNSRIGVRASSDLGQGYTASARYEFATFTNREGNTGSEAPNTRGGINDTRIGKVSLSGPFGTIAVGNQWSSFYNTVGTHLDPTVTLGYYLYSSISGGPYRTSNTVKYTNSFGPVYVEFDVRMSNNGTGAPGSSDFADEELLGRDSDNDAIDGVGIGIDFSKDNLTLALAYDQDKGASKLDETDRFGVALTNDFGKVDVTLGYYKLEFKDFTSDYYTIWAGLDLSDKTRVYGGYSWADLSTDDRSAKPSQCIMGVSHKLGGGFRLWAEGITFDSDNDSVRLGDFTNIVVGMRYDF